MASNKQSCPVIIVEDDDAIRDSIFEALEMEGYQVRSFRNGKEAIEGLKGNAQPCLILLDLMMPVMDGWQFMEERKHLPDTYAAIPVFIVSAIADQRKIEEVGAQGYIKKPMELDVLFKIVEKYCDLRKFN